MALAWPWHGLGTASRDRLFSVSASRLLLGCLIFLCLWMPFRVRLWDPWGLRNVSGKELDSWIDDFGSPQGCRERDFPARH